MRYFVLLFPMIFSGCVFVVQFLFVPSDYVLKIAAFTHPLLSKTSIYSAYQFTGNARYLYFWVYSLSFIPLTLITNLFWYLLSGDLRKRLLRAKAGSKWIVAGVALSLLIGTYTLYLSTNSYVSAHRSPLFPPNIIGCLAYAFAFQNFAFFQVGLLLKFMSLFIKS
jgi:hypothetical protein